MRAEKYFNVQTLARRAPESQHNFRSFLPWTTCANDWNSDCCTETFINGSGIRPEECPPDKNVTYPEWEYWKYRVLQVTDDISITGGMQWELVGTLVLAWVLAYCCIFKDFINYLNDFNSRNFRKVNLLAVSE